MLGPPWEMNSVGIEVMEYLLDKDIPAPGTFDQTVNARRSVQFCRTADGELSTHRHRPGDGERSRPSRRCNHGEYDAIAEGTAGRKPAADPYPAGSGRNRHVRTLAIHDTRG